MRTFHNIRRCWNPSRRVLIVGILSLCIIPFTTVTGGESTAQNSTVSISGSVTYFQGNVPVDSAEMTLSGGIYDTIFTDAEGSYQFAGLETGLDYTVTPGSEIDDTPVSALDASYILRYLCGYVELDDNQVIAGDVTEDGTVSAFDASVILKYVACEGQIVPSNFIGLWSFDPDSINYVSLSADHTNEDYVGLIIGDVSGNWRQPTIPTDTVDVFLPVLSALPGRSIRVYVNTGDVGGLDVFSAQCAITFDESDIEEVRVGNQWTVYESHGALTYSILDGKASINWAGNESPQESSPFVYLDFQISPDAQIGQTIPLHFEYFMFNEGDPWAETIDGEITIVSIPDIAVSDTSYDFGQTAIGTAKEWVLTILNEGIEDLDITDIRSDTSAFTVDETVFSIPPDSIEELTVTFAPLAEGQYEGTLTLFSDDPDEPECNISLIGVGVQSAPDISLSLSSHDFGQVAVNGLTGKGLIVSNVGTEELIVTDITSTNTDFVVDKAAFTLQPDSSEDVTVTCSPAAEGTTTATLLIFNNDPDESTVTINLLALGVTPDAVVGIFGGSGEPGTAGNVVSIDLDNSVDVVGMELVVNFDPDVLTVTGVSSTPRSAHIGIFSANLNYGPGQAKLLISATAGESIAPGTGTVAEFAFDIDAEAPTGSYPVTLSGIIVAGTRGNQLLTGIEDGTVNITGSTGVEESDPSHLMPEEYALLQNHPNPFNPGTDIRYQIADNRSPVHTTLRIYNILGQEVRTLVDEVREAGFHTAHWNGRDNNDNIVPNGVYFYRLSVNVGHWAETRKMVLMK